MPEEEQSAQPTEEELKAQLEEEIRNVRVEDVVLQSVVSILNLAARRIAKDDERDLAQAKVGIDAARALVDLVKPEAQSQLRQAISELQVLYARHAGEGAAEPSGGEEGAGGDTEGIGDGSDDASARDSATRETSGEPPDSRRSDSGLWTPPGSGGG